MAKVPQLGNIQKLTKKQQFINIFNQEIMRRAEGAFDSNRAFRHHVIQRGMTEIDNGISLSSASTMYNEAKLMIEAMDPTIGLGRDPKGLLGVKARAAADAAAAAAAPAETAQIATTEPEPVVAAEPEAVEAEPVVAAEPEAVEAEPVVAADVDMSGVPELDGVEPVVEVVVSDVVETEPVAVTNEPEPKVETKPKKKAAAK